ncbi:MAG: autotransporter outer membrane beta-barrel domain-containing protein [Sterolibacterium sp.]|nr:autotransporter outer membrane beta-barrel domain-containing protein [Sterolibacterium sp.]
MKTRLRHAALVAGLITASCAQAQGSCGGANGVLFGYAGVVNLFPVSAEYYISENPTCFGGPLTSYNQINATSFAQANAISQSFAMQQPVAGPEPHAQAPRLGMSAGGNASQWNIWGNVNNNDTRLHYLSTMASAVRNDTKITTATFGADYTLTPAMTLGFSGAVDDGDGSGQNDGLLIDNIDTRGWLFAPYFGWRIDNSLALDISAGWGRGKLKLDDANTQAKATRWFGAANLNYSRWLNNWQFSSRASYLHGVEDYDDTVDRATGTPFIGTRAKNTLGQIRLHTQAGYWLDGIMPFVSLAYSNDIYRRTTLYGAPSHPAGRDGWLIGAGVNFFSLKNGLTGGVVYNHESGRSNQKFHSLTANLSQRF